MAKRLDPKVHVLAVAAKSPCESRKVGAVITDEKDNILAEGYNHSATGLPCEDASGATEDHVIHAEDMAIRLYHINIPHFSRAKKIYVTHNPCANCRKQIAEELGTDVEIIVVGAFMKFDSDKLRFDLIPNSWHKGDAEILTYGAKKYKPNNWKEVEDIGRYIAALERHLSDFKLALEEGDCNILFDTDSKFHHMKHIRTNAGFLLTLTETPEIFYANRDKGLFKNIEVKDE